MMVSLLDYVDFNTMPTREKMYSAITKEVQFIDSVVKEITKNISEIKKELENENFGINTSKLTEELLDVKGDIIDGCINRVKNDFPSLYFNSNLLTRAGFHMKPFDARTFINYIKKTYENTDFLTLEQWKYAIIDEMVPARKDGEWQEWEDRTAENIKDIDSAGIELYFRGCHFESDDLLNIVVKFSKFVLGGQQSNLSEIEGFPMLLKEMEAGKAYNTEELKSIRFYNGDKHRLKIGFKTPEQRQLFKDMLFTSSWELLGTDEPEKPEFKDACDICIFKGVSCMQCNDYDHWVGSCSFCQHNKIYPRYRSGECDLCKTSRRDSFIPIQEVQQLSGLVHEVGYYHNHWRARKFVENPALKVHCFAWGGLYKHYVSRNYSAPVCIGCRMCITEKQDGDITQRCKSERVEKHEYYFVYNCKRTVVNTKKGEE